MKKIFTLLFCIAIISSAFAQEENHDWRYSNNNSYGYHNSYRDHHDHDGRFRINFFIYRNNQYRFEQKDELIARISSRYDYQIQQVANDYSLRPHEKRREIRNLQAQKEREINNITAQCNDNFDPRYQSPHYRHYEDDDN